jgi:hypothetical protein
MPLITDTQSSEVKSIFNMLGVPDYIWYPIMMEESGGNSGSNANNAKEDSRGLFQINVKAHPQWANVDLYDTKTNATYAATYFILPAYKAAVKKGITDPAAQAEYVWRYGIKPNWALVVKNGKDVSLKERAQEISGGVADPTVPGSSGGSTGGGTYVPAPGEPGSGSYIPPKYDASNNYGVSLDGSFDFGIGSILGVDMDRLFGNILFLLLGLLLLIAGIFIAFGGSSGIGGVISTAASLAGAA